MWINRWILCVTLSMSACGVFAQSAEVPESALSVEPPASSGATVKRQRLEGDVHLELRAEKDLRDRPQTRSSQNVHEISVGGRYEFDPTAAVRVELSAERLGNGSSFFAKQAFIDWTPWDENLRVRLGQQFLPVGQINERDNWFSSNPPFLRRLLTVNKAIDLGGTLEITPFNQRWLYLEGGVFSGRLVREEDDRSASPEKAPTVMSVKSDGPWHQAFATYFEHDLAFHDPIEAWGAGFELRAPKHWVVKPALLTEYWRLHETQRFGPDQYDRAWLVNAELTWWRLTIGERWSENRAEVVRATARLNLAPEVSRLYYFDVAIVPEVHLRAERVMETQDEVARDEWVARALVDWTFR